MLTRPPSMSACVSRVMAGSIPRECVLRRVDGRVSTETFRRPMTRLRRPHFSPSCCLTVGHAFGNERTPSALYLPALRPRFARLDLVE